MNGKNQIKLSCNLLIIEHDDDNGNSLICIFQNASWATWVGRVNGDFLETSITMESTGLVDKPS